MMPREPSSKECTDGATIDVGDGVRGRACWYPQMGGYSSKCVVVASCRSNDDPGQCFEAYVWHDGEFPFTEGNPAQLHHCRASQFRDFADRVEGFLRGEVL